MATTDEKPTRARGGGARFGEPWGWFSGAALTVALMITGLLVYVVLVNGLGYFWAPEVVRLQIDDETSLMGPITGTDRSPATDELRYQLKVGNKDWYGADFRWVDSGSIRERDVPPDAVVLEREENGQFFGFLQSVDGGSVARLEEEEAWARLEEVRRAVAKAREDSSAAEARMETLTDRMAKLDERLKRARLEHPGVVQSVFGFFRSIFFGRPTVEKILARRAELEVELDRVLEVSLEAQRERRSAVATFRDASGREGEIVVDDIVRAFRPNRMSFGEKMRLYGARIVELLTDEPRESNQEGGLFPAIFGTVSMVFLMSLFCVPLGVLAAVYLHEYAKEGLLVKTVRIAVNNLAGVPSIVYGIFGLGFFVYTVGGGIDEMLFEHRLPEPTFGTGGILWASLALALLTVPVVIVSTEEGLSSIPSGVREGSLGLGATKFQTLTRIILPMSSPGIITGLVLAMARAAGEVAPLMLLGVVKLAPTLPVDGEFPFVHFDRKFMHLGYHIYDVGFQSPNVEAARPMVYVTTMLLVLVVVTMSLTAILLRNRMRKKYTSGSF